MRISVLLISTCVAATLTGCKDKDAAVPTPPPAAAVQSVETLITGQDIARRIEALSDDKLEGRPSAGPAAEMTMQYLESEMKAAGLTPMGVNGTYRQPVQLTEVTAKDSSSAVIAWNGGEKRASLRQRDNAVFWTKRYAESVGVEDSELVFVGYGTVAPEFGWNDYEGLNVTGKTVVMLVNDPGFESQDPELFKGETMTYYGRWTYKFEEAARQGAAAAIVIHEDKPASYGWNVVADSWTGGQFDLVRPDKGMSRAALEGWVTRDEAVRLFERAGTTFTEMKAAAQSKDFSPIPMGDLTLTAQIDNDIKISESANIAGGVTGSKYPDEYVLYMGHWDHLGMKEAAPGEDGIYNGAVDNATGTAAIIEIGEAFAKGEQPERSIIVLAVTAEESGLLGSAYYAEDPLVPLEKTVAGINIDAILPVGETKDIIVVGYGASQIEDRLKTLLDAQGKYIVPDQNPSAGYFYRSDHISLAKKGVPMLYADSGIDHMTLGKDYGRDFGDLYTKERYHQPADEYSADWDMSGIESTSRLFYALGMNISNTEEWPNWYEGSEFRSLRDEMLK